jgi:hypothetical protein
MRSAFSASPLLAFTLGAVVDVDITPEPSEQERRAILAALALEALPDGQSRWRESGFDELRGDALAQEPGGDAGVVEP